MYICGSILTRIVTITGVELPAMAGRKDWGTYTINGLAVKGLAVSAEMLSLDVADGVTLQVREVSIEFDAFNWEYNKTTFPQIADSGKAATTVIDLQITLWFELSTTPKGERILLIASMYITLNLMRVALQAGLW